MDHRLKLVKRLVENSRIRGSEIATSGLDLQDMIRQHFSDSPLEGVKSRVNAPGQGADVTVDFSHQDRLVSLNIEAKKGRETKGGDYTRVSIAKASPLGIIVNAMTTDVSPSGSSRMRIRSADLPEKEKETLAKTPSQPLQSLLFDHIGKNEILIHGSQSRGYSVITRRRKHTHNESMSQEDNDKARKEAEDHNSMIDTALRASGLEETHSYHDQESFDKIFKIHDLEPSEPKASGGPSAAALRILIRRRIPGRTGEIISRAKRNAEILHKGNVA